MENQNNSTFKRAIEKKEKARLLLDQGKLQEAFSAFEEAGHIFRDIDESSYAADCYASAAKCWTIRCGEELYYNAASRYQMAAEEREKYFDFFLASSYYQHAAEYFQRNNFWRRYSECYYKYKNCIKKEAFYLKHKINI